MKYQEEVMEFFENITPEQEARLLENVQKSSGLSNDQVHAIIDFLKSSPDYGSSILSQLAEYKENNDVSWVHDLEHELSEEESHICDIAHDLFEKAGIQEELY